MKVKRVVLGEGLVASYAGKYATLTDFLDPTSSNTPDLYHTIVNLKPVAGKTIRLIAEIIESPKPIIRERKV